MVSRFTKEHGLTIASGITALGGLTLAYAVGNYIDNGHLLNDAISWNPHVDPMLNIAKYSGETIAIPIIGSAFYALPPFALWQVKRSVNVLSQRQGIK